MVVLYDGKMGIFEAQHPPIPEGLHVLMQTNFLLFDRFLWDNITWIFEGAGSCGSTPT